MKEEKKKKDLPLDWAQKNKIIFLLKLKLYKRINL